MERIKRKIVKKSRARINKNSRMFCKRKVVDLLQEIGWPKENWSPCCFPHLSLDYHCPTTVPGNGALQYIVHRIPPKFSSSLCGGQIHYRVACLFTLSLRVGECQVLARVNPVMDMDHLNALSRVWLTSALALLLVETWRCVRAGRSNICKL